jgi:hypothetical protein
MRKTIIFGTIAALFGLVAAAQAGNDVSNDRAKPFAKDAGQITQKADTDGRGERAEVKKQERGEHERVEMSARERTGSREHAKEARERGHGSGAYEDRD